MARRRAGMSPTSSRFDIKLLDLSRFISTLSVGRNGRTALLTDDGKIVGVTAPSMRSDDGHQARGPEDRRQRAGSPMIAAALEKWEAEARPYRPV